MISCIVPVFNNRKTIGHVLDALLNVEEIGEIIVVDDCSKDNSREILKEYEKKCKVLYNPKNLGKGGAVVRGIEQSSGEILFLCDADLAEVQTKHIKELLRTFINEEYDMVIAGRSGLKNPYTDFMNWVSGERVLYKKNIEEFFDLVRGSGNGIEQITNFAHRNKKVKMIINTETGHILKYQKGNFPGWVVEYVKEGYQLAKTQMVLSKIELEKLFIKK